ncbi:MAG TPA: pyridoxamine 5'-phosphate oxidase family protein [Dehalococcoidales bacterium]|nr:pyridoxamine 5'-phosphate oxidase family protein [Dehalococcoidales bacterium]
MALTKGEVLALLNANPMCYMATAEGNQPRVRAMGMYKADETGIYFQAWKIKDVHKQIEKNPAVELCFNTKDGKQIRVSGKFEIIEDLALKKEVEAKRPFMTPIIKGRGGYEVVAIYRMQKGKATVWTMAENFTPKNYIEL